MSGTYPSEIVIQGKKYVHGPRLAPELCKVPEKCAHCAKMLNGLACQAFGWECLERPEVYWIEKKSRDVPRERLADVPAGERAKCDHCRRRFRKTHAVAVGGETWCPWCADKHAVECLKCGRTVPEDGTAKVGFDTWCPDCVARHAETCACCGRRANGQLMSVVSTVEGDVRWCPECASRKAKRCARCGKLVPLYGSVTVDGESWCAGCADGHTTECEDCGNRTAAVGEEGEGSVCPECTRKRAARAVHGYHGFGRRTNLPFWSGTAGSEPLLYLGFELEAGGTDGRRRDRAAVKLLGMSSGENRFHMEHDGTIPDHGFELISSPHTLAAHKDYGWDRILKVMLDNGMRSHDLDGQCGLHVHVSRSFLSLSDLVKVDLFVLKNRLFWERVARRTSQEFSRYDTKTDLDEFGRSASRRSAVNFTNQSTVEFRMFRGTLKFSTLMATLEIVDGICRWVKTRSVEALNENDGETDKFTDWLAERPEYARAVKYIRERKAVAHADDASEGAGD